MTKNDYEAGGTKTRQIAYNDEYNTLPDRVIVTVFTTFQARFFCSARHYIPALFFSISYRVDHNTLVNFRSALLSSGRVVGRLYFY